MTPVMEDVCKPLPTLTCKPAQKQHFFQEHGMTQPDFGIHQEFYTHVLHLFEHLDEESTNTARGMPHDSTCSCEDEVGTFDILFQLG